MLKLNAKGRRRRSGLRYQSETEGVLRRKWRGRAERSPKAARRTVTPLWSRQYRAGAKSFVMGAKWTARKSLRQGESGYDGQSAFANDGRSFFQRDETSRRNGAITGASAAVAEFGRVGAWGEQVLGKIASKKTVIIMLFFQVLRGGG